MLETPPFAGTPEIKQPVPGRAPFDGARSPSRTVTPLLSPGTPSASVWRRSGTVARSRKVG